MLNVEDPLVPVPVDLESYVNDAISAGSDRDVVSLMADYFREIAESKMADLNANDLDQASKIIAGTARSMGITVEA